MKAKDLERYLQIAGGMKDMSRDINAIWIHFWFWRIQEAETCVGSYKLEKYLFGFGLMIGWPYFQRVYSYVPPDHTPTRSRGQKKRKAYKKIVCWRWHMRAFVFYRNHQFSIPSNAVIKRDFNGHHSWN